MKYTIMGFSQKIMVESGLNLTDSSILRFVVDFYHTGKMKKIVLNGKEYIWISYKYVSESLPIIHSGLKSTSERTKKKRIADSIDRLANAGVIEKVVTKDPQGTFVFVRIVEQTYEQYIARVTEITVTGYQKGCNGVTEITVTKDKSIKDSSIKDSKYLNPLQEYLEKKINEDGHHDLKDQIVSFFRYRMAKPKGKQYNTERGINGLFRDLNGCRESGLNLFDCMEIAMENNWQTPNPEYFKNKSGGNNGKTQHNYTGIDNREPILPNRFPKL